MLYEQAYMDRIKLRNRFVMMSCVIAFLFLTAIISANVVAIPDVYVLFGLVLTIIYGVFLKFRGGL